MLFTLAEKENRCAQTKAGVKSSDTKQSRAPTWLNTQEQSFEVTNISKSKFSILELG